MYVTTNGTGNNKYVVLMESYRDDQGVSRKRVVERLGRLDALLKDDPMALENLKAKYAGMMKDKRLELDFERQAKAAAMLAASKAASDEMPFPTLNYGHYPLLRIWEEDLGLKRKLNYLQRFHPKCSYDINDTAAFLMCTKIMDPHSVLFTFGDKDNFLGDPARNTNLDGFYETLGLLHANKDDILATVNRRMDATFGKTRARLVFYDVTNTYFETPLTDAEKGYVQADYADQVQAFAEEALAKGILKENNFDVTGDLILEDLPDVFIDALAREKLQYLRMRGPSKEHRFDMPITSIVLVIDELGFPMDFAVCAGNKAEVTGMKGAIAELKKKYPIEGAIVVADRGLNSGNNLKMLKDQGLGFLVAQKVTKLSKDLTKKMTDLSNYTDIDPNNPAAGKYFVVQNWQKTITGSTETVPCTLVLTYNDKRRRRDELLLELKAEIVRKKAAAGEKLGPRKSGWADLALTEDSVDSPIIGVDTEALERKKKLCGFAGMVFQNPDIKTEDGKQETVITDAEVANTYHQLNKIENCFRIMKSNLGLRPMYVRNSNQIRGHVLICVLSLLTVLLLQHKLKKNHVHMSIGRICRELRGATVSVIPNGNEFLYAHTARPTNRRKGRERLSTEELLVIARKEKLVASHMPAIMRAVELTPLPRLCTRSELGRCLRKRFSNDADVLPELVYQDCVTPTSE